VQELRSPQPAKKEDVRAVRRALHAKSTFTTTLGAESTNIYKNLLDSNTLLLCCGTKCLRIQHWIL
jgi:hypothetical protein